ncbi:MAG: hypothetical protein HFF18_14690 [Oscillospiraceae bacterium]|nr:hypothetical protein [Oscillospiraceae bacterium]
MTFKERLHNAIGTQEIERKKVYHAYVHCIAYEREEFDKIWFKGENSTWGHNFGRMVGFRQIYHNHTIDEESRAAEETFQLGEAFPSYMGGDPRSIGASGVHALSELCIEMARDGRSGRCWAITAGVMMAALGRRKFGPGGPGGPGGPKEPPRAEDYVRGGAASWEYYGADFIYHEGEWKYIHEHVVPVFAQPFDNGNFARELYEQHEKDPDYDTWRGCPCQVTDPGPLSRRYDVNQEVQHLIWETPRPYDTLDDDNTYSIGHNEWV